MNQNVLHAMVARARRDGDVLDRLTPRQAEVLALVAEGRSNAAIARKLVITEKAVVQHVSHIYDQPARLRSYEIAAAAMLESPSGRPS